MTVSDVRKWCYHYEVFPQLRSSNIVKYSTWSHIIYIISHEWLIDPAIWRFPKSWGYPVSRTRWSPPGPVRTRWLQHLESDQDPTGTVHTTRHCNESMCTWRRRYHGQRNGDHETKIPWDYVHIVILSCIICIIHIMNYNIYIYI